MSPTRSGLLYNSLSSWLPVISGDSPDQSLTYDPYPLRVLTIFHIKIRDSSDGIVTGYELDGRGSIPDRSKRFSLLHTFRTGAQD
jgi:hypothetical protein